MLCEVKIINKFCIWVLLLPVARENNSTEWIMPIEMTGIIIRWMAWYMKEFYTNSCYCYFLGTSQGANDVVAYVSVGVVNHKVFHSLRLQNGYVYYASVTG